jgi:hypothetical protein
MEKLSSTNMSQFVGGKITVSKVLALAAAIAALLDLLL